MLKINNYKEIDEDLINSKNSLKGLVDEKMSSYKVNEALEIIFENLRKCNKYIDETEPWVLSKDVNKLERLETIIYNLLDNIRVSAILLEPFIPETSKKILKSLNFESNDFSSLNAVHLKYDVGLEKPENLFNRIQ